MPSNNPIFGHMDAWVRSYMKKGNELLAALRKYIGGGMPVQKAAKRALDEVRFTEWMVTSTAASAALAASEFLPIDKAAYSDWWLSRRWRGEELTLSQRVTKSNFTQAIANEINEGLAKARSWTALTRDITRLDPFVEDVLPKSIKRLERAAKSAGVSARTLSEYKKELTDAQRAVNRLGKDTASKGALRKAYQGIITAAESGSAEALDNAIARGVMQKNRYLAERIARTEIAKAYGEAVAVSQKVDADIVGWKWSLSSRHAEFDICDLHAEADLYGMGKGVYPVGAGPGYPAHPNCRCVIRSVYKGDVGEYNPERAKEYINSLSPKRQKQLLGVKGQRNFVKNNDSWNRNLKNWNGQPGRVANVPQHVVKKNVAQTS